MLLTLGGDEKKDKKDTKDGHDTGVYTQFFIEDFTRANLLSAVNLICNRRNFLSGQPHRKPKIGNASQREGEIQPHIVLRGRRSV